MFDVTSSNASPEVAFGFPQTLLQMYESIASPSAWVNNNAFQCKCDWKLG